MTNLEAIKASVNYPISDDQADLALTDREVTSGGTYAGITQAFELAKADILVLLCSSANVQEGGYSISMTDKSNMLSIARGIYERYGVEHNLSPKVRDATSRW